MKYVAITFAQKAAIKTTYIETGSFILFDILCIRLDEIINNYYRHDNIKNNYSQQNTFCLRFIANNPLL